MTKDSPAKPSYGYQEMEETNHNETDLDRIETTLRELGRDHGSWRRLYACGCHTQ